MRIAYNPKTAQALVSAPDNEDITFDLSGLAIYAKGVKFEGKVYSVFKKHTLNTKGGYDGLVPAPSYTETITRYLREDGTWAVPTNTIYTFASGTTGDFTVTPSGGTAQTVSIGKPATAGTADVAVKLQTKRKLWGLDFDGSADVSGDMTGVGNITINATGNKDYFINFLYNSTPTYSWRLGYLGSGSADANYFVIDSSKSSGGTWHRALQIGNETLDATFTGTVIAPTFKGNLDGTYVNKLTSYTKSTTASDIVATDTLNAALGKLEYKAHYAYNWVTTVTATDTDEYINKWLEILDFLNKINDTDGSDLTDEFVTRKTAQTITGQKTFEAHDTIFTNGTHGVKLLGHGGDGWLQLGQTSGENKVHRGNISGINAETLTSLTVSARASSFSGTVTATKFITTDGTSSQFVKGDGSLDSNTYATTTSLNNYVTLDTELTITGLKTFKNKVTIKSTSTNATPRLVFDEYYSSTLGNWVSEIISDYYGNNICSTTNFTHGLYIKLGRAEFNNLIILNNSNSPIARISKEKGHWFDGTLTTTGNITATGFLKTSSSDSYVLLGGGGHKAVSDFATASGVVTSLGTNGNYVTWTKNGTVNNLTVPYAANADKLDNIDSTGFFVTNRGSVDTSYIDLTTYTNDHADYKNYNSGTYSVSRSGYSDTYVVFRATGSTSAIELMSSYTDTARLKLRKTVDSKRVSGPWQELAFTSDIPTVTNYYWANVQISDTSSTSTSPTFGKVTINTTTQTGLIMNSSNTSNGIRFDKDNGSKGWVGWDDTYGTSLYNYSGSVYFGIKPDGTPHYKGHDLRAYVFGSNTNRTISSSTNLDTLTNSNGGWWGTLDNTTYTNGPNYQNFGLLSIRLNNVYWGQLSLPYSSGRLPIKYRSLVYSSSGATWQRWESVLMERYGCSTAGTTATWSLLASWSTGQSTELGTDVTLYLHSSFSNRYGYLHIRARRGEYLAAYLLWSVNIDVNKIRVYYSSNYDSIQVAYLGGESYSLITAELVADTDRSGSHSHRVEVHHSGSPTFTSYITPTYSTLQQNISGNSDTVDNLHASDFKQVNVSNISYTPNLTHHGGSTVNSSYYYKVSISNVNNVWTMLYLELDIKENYSSGTYGKLLIHLNKNNTNGFTQVYGYTSGYLSDSIKVYAINSTTLDIYIAGNWNYPTIDVSRVNFGDSCVNVTKSISLSTTTTLSSGSTLATIIKGLSSSNYTSYLGYIGTTAVQASSATQSLTGITDVTMSGSINNVLKATTSLNAALLNVSEIVANINYIHLYVSSLNSSATNTRALVLQNGYGNVGIGTTVPTSKLHLVGDFTTSGDIYYTGSLATNRMIRFLNNTADAYGNGIEIGGGGLTVVGGGEAASLISASVAAGIENLVLCADEIVEFYSNCQSNLTSAYKMTFGKDGNLTVPGNIYISANKALIQTQASTSNYTSAIEWYKGGTSNAKYDPQIGQHNTGGSDGTGSICILPYATDTAPWDSKVGLWLSKTHLFFEGKTVLHSGNYTSYLGYIGTTAVQSSSATQNLTGIGSINMAGDILVASNGDTGLRLIRLCGGSNDFGRIAVGATGNNAGWMEIATADDATEPIYVRLYSGTYETLKRTLTLLDSSGDTSIPNNLSVGNDLTVNRYLSFGYTGYLFTTDIRSSWRSSVFGNTTHGSRFRTLRTDYTLDKFSEIYSSGITWAAADTHGYLSTTYSSKKAFIGGGSGDSLNWTAELIHSSNIGSQSVNYASSAGNADTLDGYHADSFLQRLRRANLDISSSYSGMVPPDILSFKNGYPIYTDPEFANGNNSISVYNNSGGSAVTITREASTTSGNSSGYCLHIKSAASGASPNGGGWYFATLGTQARVSVCVFRANIPTGYSVEWHSNSIGTGSNHGWLTSTSGTGKYEWYAYMVEWGASPSSTFFFTLNKAATVDWYLSYANVIDVSRASYDGLRTRYSDYATSADTVDGVHLEWAGSQAASSTEWLAGWTSDGTKLKAVKRADLSVNYASSAGSVPWSGVTGKPNIFTLIGGKSVDFNFGDGNNNNGLYYLHDNYTQSNKNGITYGSLMNFSCDASSWQLLSSANSVLYYRQRWWSGGGGTWSSWKQIAFTSDITDYYWANVKISSSSNAATEPTFKTATATTSVTTPLVTNTGILTLNGTSGVYLKYNYADASSLVLSSTYFKPFDSANNKISLGTSSARWSTVYSTAGNFTGDVTLLSSSGDSPKLYFVRGGAIGDSGALWDWRMYSSSGYFYLESDLGTGTWSTALFISTNHNVGIGTTSPVYKLDVVGSAGFGTSSACDVFLRRSGGYSYINATSSLALTVNNNSGNIAVGIATDKHATFYGSQTLHGLTSTCNKSSDSNYMNSALQIREYNFGGALADSWGIAPRLSWHWSGRVQTQIGLNSSGDLKLSKDNFATSYLLLHAGNSSVSGGGSSGGSSITVNIGGTSKTLTIPTSLPANGGNADTVDSYHATDLVREFWTSSPGYDGNTYNGSPIVTFSYSNNTPYTGVFIDLNTNGYGVMFNTGYYSDTQLAYRRHGTSSDGKMGSWRYLIDDVTIGLQSVNYATSAGNADTVDGYHASSLWRSDGATWNPTANITMTPTSNGQEWSFDFRNKGSFTGSYWHVWDESKNTLLKVDADSGAVSAPYGFVGNLSGNATSAGNADTLDNLHASAFAKIGTYNNLTHAGNEFTFASSAFSGEMWFNYRTASGSTDGNITKYYFGNGKAGSLAYISDGYFSGTAAAANSVAWSNVTGKPTIPTVTNYYWANVKVSSSSNTATTPTFSTIATTSTSYVATLRPATTETHYLGSAEYRWNNVFSKLGNFSGLITSSVATGTAPFKITSTTVNTNLNADMVDGLHASDFVRAIGTLGLGNSYDSDWGLSMVTFDPIVSGTAAESNPNVTILNLGNDYARRKQLWFNYDNNNIYYRRKIGSSWSSWVRLALTSEIPTNTWRGITDSYSGTDSTISLSQKGGNALYSALVNGYASSAGNADTVDGYHIVVTNSVPSSVTTKQIIFVY